jgi:hypothetical protein
MMWAIYDTNKPTLMKTNFFAWTMIMKSLYLVLLLLSLSFSSKSWAQTSPDDVVKQTQGDLLVVVGAGVGGAVLGLSTLSFYETPSKNISNVWTGAALGIIAGVIFVALSHAQKAQDDFTASKDFTTSDRFAWHSGQSQSTSFQAPLSSNLWVKSF